MYVEIVCASLWPSGIAMTLIRNVKKNNFNHITADLLKACIGMVIFTITLSCGQEVNTQVERLHESSYMSKWYEETPKVRRDLLMLMIRTTKPITVNYRLFVTFDRECLATVLQGIYSFLMMIISFDTDS
ncbi:hypothetical protein O3M35_009745 [Rhynocoris fuscipes]|uniref:Uncharacterized protein n=1 Tax=Rhynocoris fuscipes TaxID=488301 RepID=A0AAW1D446_9HEMI